MQQVFGEAAVSRGLGRLPADVRTVYADANALDWIEYDVVRQVREAVAAELGISVEAMLSRAVPVALERTFQTVWRVMLRFTTDDALVARTPTIYSKTRDRGSMQARMVDRGHAEAIVEGWPRMPADETHALAVSVETVLRLAGRTDVRVFAQSTASGARLDARWSP